MVFCTMDAPRSRHALLLSGLGAIMLAISVFLPWYGVSFTQGGIEFVQREGDQLATQYGNPALQSYLGTFHSSIAGLAGHQFAALSAHQALKIINVVLLLIAGATILLSLIPLAGSDSPRSGAGRSSIAALGALATVCVLFRMVDRPGYGGEGQALFALSLREGAWLALLGSLAMLIGGLLPPRITLPGAGASERGDRVLAELSGWTPES